MLEAIVFDFDGVLVDSEPLHYLAIAMVGKSLGVELDYARYLRDYIGFDDRDAFREVLKEAGREGEADGGLLVELCEQKQRAFDGIIGSGQAAAIPGAVELVKACVAEGLPIAIASGATRRDIDQLLASPALELTEAFGVIVTADDVAKSKPDPQTYRLAVEELGVEAGGCLAIEDTAAGLASAQGAGLMTLGLGTTGPIEALAGRADRLAEDLSRLTLGELRGLYE